MVRRKCESCPFRPGSKYYHMKERWEKAVENDFFESGTPFDGSVVQACHEINDCGPTSNPDEMCIGHKEWVEERMNHECANAGSSQGC